MIVEVLLSLACLSFVLQRRTPGVDKQLFHPNDQRIRCPRCAWEPQKQDRWFCDPGCHCRWNTFDTAGVCPQCAKEWEQTACLSCHQWSLHAEWYEPGH